MSYASLLAAPGAASAVSDGRIVLNAGLLKGMRKERGISQEALAELCFTKQLCVSIASIKRAETGKPVLYRTARHLATILGVDLGTLAGQAGATGLAAAPLPIAYTGNTAATEEEAETQHAAALRRNPVPGLPLEYSDDVIRYVLELRFEARPEVFAQSGESSAAGDELMQLIRQFGGVIVAADASSENPVVVHFGFPHAYRSDSERCLLCAFALRGDFVRAGHAIWLRLVRWPGDAAVPAQYGKAFKDQADAGDGRAPIYVARSLVVQLAARFDFAPAGDEFASYRKCLRARPQDGALENGLTGRTIEILQFKGVVEATQECQNGHVVYVRGMAGVGKTRLVTEFSEIARQSQFSCHQGEVQDFGMESSYAPLRQLVRSLLGLSGSVTGVAQDAVLHAALERWKLPAEANIFLQVLAGAAPARQDTAVYAAMSNEARMQGSLRAMQLLLVRLALQQPLLICLEDLHWGDAHLFAALGSLLSLTDEAPILWLLTSRNEGDPLESALRPRFSNPLSLLDIAPMRAREAALLAEQFTDVDPGYRAHCVEKAQGNPLYLTQLLSNPAGTVPESLKHLIQARLDRLEPEHRRALSMASVIGNRFELSALRVALEQADYQPARTACQNLIKEIEPGCYMFVHDLVMHCIYDAIPLSLRNSYHRRVAGPLRQSDPTLYARHLVRAQDPAAFEALLNATRGKLRSYQYDDAMELAQLCDSFADKAAVSFELALLRARAAAGIGKTTSSRQYFQRAMQLAEHPDEKIEAALGLAPVLNTLDSLDEEERLLQATLPLARNAQADDALARLFHLQGNIFFPRGDYMRCRDHHQEALHFSRISENLESQANALSGIGDSYYAEGRMQTAHDVFDRCVRLCERNDLMDVVAPSRSARGSTLIYLGRPALALQDAMDSVRHCRTVGNRRAEIFSRLTAAWVLVATAADESAREELSTALEIARSIGASRFEAILLEGLARVAFWRDDQAQAQARILEAAELVERLQLQRYIGPWIWGSLALITEDPGMRQNALQKGEAQLAHGCLAHNAFRFYVAAAETSLMTGGYGQASRYAQQMAVLVQAESCIWVDHHVRLIGSAVSCLQERSHAQVSALQNIFRASEELGFAATMPRLARKLGQR
ncbi:putative ATPase [Collimonas sp. PA-H2]|uniref:helix-turn-helix domain-containing protein n=1 Tax=Collimonas sp. PA-H2 TaxID=1881062 RepID=UPI000BF261F4|nr:helix-turn-helix domain-containing protein [Collimonas sp. PA-H2]PFH10024.1 putative ATPase [Collimonas sp. PA-H2]